MFRIGNGFDSHRLEANYKLILGGIPIPHSKGLVGHSDADVLTHAIIDALLGASNLGDIGELFPSSDPAYKGISSLLLLQKTLELLIKHNWQIINLDCILICEQPKISPHKQSIINSLSQVLGIRAEQISLKAKTAEKMGALGREEGIACLVVVLLETRPQKSVTLAL
jgi:2-C-methyl-D-erythritol 2,4-cyclodiphosphate synthase